MVPGAICLHQGILQSVSSILVRGLGEGFRWYYLIRLDAQRIRLSAWPHAALALMVVRRSPVSRRFTTTASSLSAKRSHEKLVERCDAGFSGSLGQGELEDSGVTFRWSGLRYQIDPVLG